MAGKYTYFVDPTTKALAIDDDGDPQTAGAGIMAAVNAVLTERGTVPDLADFGSAYASVSHLGESTPREMERCTDDALRPLRGVAFDDYERQAAWDDANNPVLSVSTFRDDVEEGPLDLPVVS